ncbi:hypothetical protein CAG99_08190 [Streptomyces marincola]|uniref:Toxin-antitoxin system HicB family antitoxin n=1 Tax=Streptomyces marincola TaxID=2878388 RepID=A0A1W7CVJ1_9ACTN|nr:hypothetical protein CAG99_08190 [Streptomyces marincola]
MTEGSAPRGRARKQVLLRLDPAVHDALSKWAADELRSTNAQIDYLLRQALREAGRLPSGARPHPRRGRPPGAGHRAGPADGQERTRGDGERARGGDATDDHRGTGAGQADEAGRKPGGTAEPTEPAGS